MLTQLYSFQTTTGLYMASLKTGHSPKRTYLKENTITYVTGPCHTDGLPANAEGNMLPSLILIPTRVWHVEYKSRTVRAVRAHGGQQEPGAGADTLAVVLLQSQGGCCRRWVSWGSPGYKQTGRPDRQGSGSCILITYVASVRGAERTLCFSQAEHLVPQWTQIHLPLCNMCGGEQHRGSTKPLCTSSHCSKCALAAERSGLKWINHTT